MGNINSILQKPIPFPFYSKIPSDSVYPNIKMAFEYTRSLTGVIHVFPDTTWGSENTPSWWWGYFLRDLWSSIRAASDTPHCVFSRRSVLARQQVGSSKMFLWNRHREQKHNIFAIGATSKYASEATFFFFLPLNDNTLKIIETRPIKLFLHGFCHNEILMKLQSKTI